MSSGYEKSPDYGGPEPTRWGIAILVAAVIAVAALVALTRSAPAQSVLIEGNLDCGRWDAARRDNAADAYQAYFLGLINGLVLGTFLEFWEAGGSAISREATYLWLDGYCRENPLSSVPTGATVLFKERAGWPR